MPMRLVMVFFGLFSSGMKWVFSKDFLDSVDGVGWVGLTEFFQKNIFYIFYF